MPDPITSPLMRKNGEPVWVLNNLSSIRGEDGSQLRAYRDNMGEPYREGISIWVSRDGTHKETGLFMETRDLDDTTSSKLKAVVDILQSRLHKRGVPLKALTFGTVETGGG